VGGTRGWIAETIPFALFTDVISFRVKFYSLPVLLALAAGLAGVSFYAGRNFPVESPSNSPKAASPVVAATSPAPAKPSLPAPKPEPAKNPAAAPKKELSREEMLAGLLMKLGEISPIRNPDGYRQGLSDFEKGFVEWFAASPEEAAQFLSTSPQRDTLLKLAIATWAKSDPSAASAWLAAHPDTPGRDAMATGLAMAVFKEDPNASIQWISSIKDPAQKLSGAESLGWEFYRRSDSEAAEVLGRMGLPESAAGPLTQNWSAKLTAVAKRNAQNLVSIANAVEAAGGTLDTSSLDSVVRSLTSGIHGGGQFATSVFQVSTTDWTGREKEASLKSVKVADGKVRFEETKP
jgi:hypothetical protein